MARRYKTRVRRKSSFHSEGKIIWKPVIITSIVALVLGLLIVAGYYFMNTRIGGNLLHNNDDFTVHTLEDGHKVFPLKFELKTADNETVILSEKIKGKEGVIINFFNSVTENCTTIMKEIKEVESELSDAYVLNINVGDDIPVIENYLEDNELDIELSEIVVDMDMKMFEELGYEGLPVLAVIDNDGTILGEIEDSYTAAEIINGYKGIMEAKGVTEETDEIDSILD